MRRLPLVRRLSLAHGDNRRIVPCPCRIAIVSRSQNLLGGGFTWFAGRELLRLLDSTTCCAIRLSAGLGLLEHVLLCHFGCRDEQLAFL